MNKREALLNLVNSKTPPDYVPAAFFLHFDPAYHQGQPAIDKHLEFFRATGMDFVKIQYEQTPTPLPTIRKPEDWASAPLYIDADFEPTLQVVEGLVKAAKAEALVIVTVYSPFMWAGQLASADVVATHLKEKPEAVKEGLEILTENVLTLVRACNARVWTGSMCPRRAASLSASRAPTYSRNISSPLTWLCGARSRTVRSTSCTSATITAGTTT